MAIFISNPSEVTNDMIQKYGWWLNHRPNDEVIEKLKFKPVQYILKLLVFNAAAVCIYFLLIFVFSVPADDFEYFGINIPALFLIIINPVFLLYDYAITVVLRVYRQKINNFVTKMTKKF